MCAANQKPRKATVQYFCDTYHSHPMKILEISEPDWCDYSLKVATKYLCGRSNLNEFRINKET